MWGYGWLLRRQSEDDHRWRCWLTDCVTTSRRDRKHVWSTAVSHTRYRRTDRYRSTSWPSSEFLRHTSRCTSTSIPSLQRTASLLSISWLWWLWVFKDFSRDDEKFRLTKLNNSSLSIESLQSQLNYVLWHLLQLHFKLEPKVVIYRVSRIILLYLLLFIIYYFIFTV